MDLKEKIVSILQTENKKNPFTDAKLAKLLSTTRETITVLRRELSIGNSRERRQPYLERAVESIVRQNEPVNVSDITRKLLESGFDISRHVVEEILSGISSDSIAVRENETGEQDPFAVLVGYGGSLEKSVTQSKSAILYPPFGLPTLIIGESGVGKTQFAECMYHFAKQKKVIGENAPFVVFNCADYGDNPQLLLSLLYGCKKGAFTGADSDTEGLVEQAHEGVLFLDEIHRLPPKGQEILFSILDRGQFRRLGETKSERNVKIRFIGATTENVESSLLLSFRRRIPMIIPIPSLYERPFAEKVEIIYESFQHECNRIHAKIFVESKVTEILTLRRFSGNIGQLKSSIQVICARAFMKQIGREQEIINIGYEDILEISSIQHDFILEDLNIVEVRNYIQDMLFLPFIKNRDNRRQHQPYLMPEDFYQQIENKYHELSKLSMNFSELEEILWTFIVNKFNDLETTAGHKKNLSLTELMNVVDKEIINLVKRLRLQLMTEYGHNTLNENIFLYLAIHLNETIKRIRLKQPIININLAKIKKDYPQEYNLAVEVAGWFKSWQQIELPEDEIGFIAMYINAAKQSNVVKNKVAVVVVSHGRIATEIVNVVRELLNVSFPIAIDMPLRENPAAIYEKIIGISPIIDEGKGILFLVDMGSLLSVGKLVTDKLNIPAKTLDRVDLLTVIEAVRKAFLPESDLDEIYASLIETRFHYPLLNIEDTTRPLAIITVCLTGEGTACHIKEVIQKKYPGVSIFQLGIMDDQLKPKIKEIQKKFKIVTIIGTINPEIEGVNFIVYEPHLLNSGLRELDFILNTGKKNDLAGLTAENLIVLESPLASQQELLEFMCSQLINAGYVKKEFLQSVMNREQIAATFLKGGIAVPHGDSLSVKKSALVVIKLKRAIAWGPGEVDLVCLPALKINDKKIVKGVLKPFLDLTFIGQLRQQTDMNEFKAMLLSKIKSC
ncbi:phosphotransferase system mannose-type iia component [Lucifera butyrica]|uniref:Phosphotransferase system mannose-type iia component n=1 Tax=Lucifera butyrica TaxID=1351585 RepID=A0A498R7H3_9FIRM|nr:sigma 54-interacting transcriptional regulator [Lucifera butyrica]VBB05078.1 phosphotransferase system mannose-type iia component [Lucifera butyrica]